MLAGGELGSTSNCVESKSLTRLSLPLSFNRCLLETHPKHKVLKNSLGWGLWPSDVLDRWDSQFVRFLLTWSSHYPVSVSILSCTQTRSRTRPSHYLKTPTNTTTGSLFASGSSWTLRHTGGSRQDTHGTPVSGREGRGWPTAWITLNPLSCQAQPLHICDAVSTLALRDLLDIISRDVYSAWRSRNCRASAHFAMGGLSDNEWIKLCSLMLCSK